MRAVPAKTPALARQLFPKRLWEVDSNDTVYLTFDDGPIPAVTPWVLDCLLSVGAKATFFCIGENARNHPGILERIGREGHALGNHTFNHLNGWKTTTSEYLENVHKVEAVFDSKLFRPPYGKIKPRQAQLLGSKGYTIVMWDVLSYDWDKQVSEEECLNNVLENIRPGSIVVFHDSLKAQRNLRASLPRVLEFIAERNWKMEALEV